MRVIDISLKDVLKRYKGYTEHYFTDEKYGHNAICPCHSDTDPSLQLHDKTHKGKGWDFFCPVCGVGGNAVTLLHWMGAAKHSSEAADMLAHDYNLKPPDKWDVRTFSEYKGLNWEILRDDGWETQQNGLLVPYYSVDGEIIAEKLRCNATSDNKYIYLKGGAQPYGLQRLKTAPKDVVYITEGETDCLTLIQAGYTAIGIPSCSAWKEEFSTYFKDFSKVVLAMDNDEAGKTLLKAISASLSEKLYLLKLPHGVKDVNDFHQYSCFSQIEDFKAKFADLKIIPSTPKCFIAACHEDKSVVQNLECWELIVPQLDNPLKEEDFVAEVSKITKYTKSSLNEMLVRAKRSSTKLEDWYTVTKSGVELNPEKFAEHLSKTIPMCRVNHIWYLYDPCGVYKKVDDSYIIYIIRQNLIPLCSKEPKNVKDTLFYLESNIQLNRESEDFDKDPFIINVKNGLLDIRTVTLVPHTHEHLSMVQRTVYYKQDTQPSEAFTSFLDEKIPDATNRKIAQEILGYAISDFYCAEKWFLIKGRGRSGKGTFLNIITKTLGKENTSSVPLQDLGERFNKSQMFGKLANIDADLGKNYITDGAVKMLKTFIGRDYVYAEYKGENGFNFVNRATMIFACNDLPPNAGDTKNASFWDKLVLLKMDKTDTDDVQTALKDKLVEQESLDYIFLWALEGLKRLIETDFVFTTGADSQELLQEYKRKSSSAISFAEECCEVGDSSTYYVLSSVFMDKYREWCHINGRDRVKQVENAVADLKEYYTETQVYRDKVRRGNDKNAQHYILGICIPSEF